MRPRTPGYNGDVVFEGTRVPLERIVSYLKGDCTIATILEDYPGVQREQIEAFLDYALTHATEELGRTEAHDEDAS